LPSSARLRSQPFKGRLLPRFRVRKQRSFEGIIERKPFPTLLVKKPGSPDFGSSHYLLVAEGKHGAGDEVSAFEGKSVRLKGTLIYRGNQTMIEVVSGSIAVGGIAEAPPAVEKMLGVFELDGEIVDGKCYLGVMNPGSGKVHRDCATRCLSGGVPSCLPRIASAVSPPCFN